MALDNNAIVFSTRIDNSKLQADANKTKGILSKFSNNMTSLLSGFGGFAAISAGVGIAINKIIQVNKDLEKSLSSLQSITGVTTEELAFFKDEAIRMGQATTQSSQDIVDAFALIGSQKPELLASKEALSGVTENALILAEAAGIDIPTAAKAVTNSLNQMNASASESGKYINIIAAGSKIGAADIPYLNSAIEKSGSIARDANLSFEQLVAGIETIAPSISEPSSAGLMFKNVLLQLQKEGYGFASGQFNLQDALIETKAKLESITDPAQRAAFETQLFGTESLVAGKALLNNIDTYNQYTKGVTGTSVALEQQAINTNNLQGSLDKFKNTLDAVILGFNGDNSLTNGLKELVDFATIAITKFENIDEIFRFIIEPIADLFKNLYDLTETLGLVSDKGDAVAGIIKILATTTKIGMLPLRALIEIVNLLVKGIGFVLAKIKNFVTSNKQLMDGLNLIKEIFDIVKNKIIEIITPIKEFINNIKYAGNAIIQSKLHGLIFQISNSISFLIGKIKEIIQQFVHFVKNNVFTVEALRLLQNYFIGIKNTIGLLVSPIKKLVTNINEFAKTVRGDNEPIAISNVTKELDKATLSAIGAQKQVSAFFNFVGSTLDAPNKMMQEFQANIDAINKKYTIPTVTSSGTESITATPSDMSSVINASEIERLKIEVMEDGLDKQLALIDLEFNEKIQKYKDNGIYTTEIASQIEQQKNDKITETRENYINEEIQRTVDFQNFQNSLLQDGIQKDIALINADYNQRIQELKNYQLTETQLLEAEQLLNEQRQLEIDKKNKEYQQSLLDFQFEQFNQEMALKESEINLMDLTEKEKNEIAIENQILRLEAQKKFNNDLTDLERQTIDNQILEQKKLLSNYKSNKEELQKIYDDLGDAVSNFGGKFIDTISNTALTQEEKSKQIKESLLNETEAVISAAVIKYTAQALGSLGFPLGAIAAPLAGLAVKGIFAALKSGLMGFEQGGLVPGSSYHGDNVLIRANSGERILTQKDQLNMNSYIKKSVSYDNLLLTTNNLLKEQNTMLKNQINTVLYKNQLLETKNGILTGNKIYLE